MASQSGGCRAQEGRPDAAVASGAACTRISCSRAAPARLGHLRFLLTIGLAVLLVAGACGSSPPPPAKAPKRVVHKRPPAPPRAPSARAVLSAYLDATLAGEHGRAWGYLSTADRSRLPRDAYIKRERANDRLRAQVRALGPFRYSLESVKEKGDDATAFVVLRSGLGSERVRFVLEKDGARWFELYDASWGSAD